MTEKVLAKPVKARRVEDLDGTAGKAPGTFELLEGRPPDVGASMYYRCPCGCGKEGVLDLIPMTDKTSTTFKPRSRPQWGWDGNPDKPTLHPSINDKDHWHGWLKNGFWSQ